MKIERSFSQNAKDYEEVNTIQKKVVEQMCHHIKEQPRTILDIGCGSGSFYKRANWPIEEFVGIDFAQGMLNEHPKDDNITLYLADFNQKETFKMLKEHHQFERIVSASALQWATNLDATLHEIASFQTPVTLAIFTANTFKTLYQTAQIPPLLRGANEVENLLRKHFPKGELHYLHYKKEFASVREIFRYMKKSGVGAGRNLLGYKEMKWLMQHYPHHFLEYEIILLHEA